MTHTRRRGLVGAAIPTTAISGRNSYKYYFIVFKSPSQALLLILTGILSFASSLYASKNFREIYHKIHIIFEDDDDSFDDRCESKSYNGLEYCVCNIGPLNPPKNATLKLLKFRGMKYTGLPLF